MVGGRVFSLGCSLFCIRVFFFFFLLRSLVSVSGRLRHVGYCLGVGAACCGGDGSGGGGGGGDGGGGSSGSLLLLTSGLPWGEIPTKKRYFQYWLHLPGSIRIMYTSTRLCLLR